MGRGDMAVPVLQSDQSRETPYVGNGYSVPWMLQTHSLGEQLQSEIVASRNHQLIVRCSSFIGDRNAFSGAGYYPFVNQILWEKPFTRNPGGGDPLVFNQSVNLLFVDAKILGDLLGGEHLFSHLIPGSS
jgi:hypothetical protein